MNTFLFIVEDREECTTKLFQLEASSTETAKTAFTKKYLPYLNFDFTALCDMLERSDVYITVYNTSEIINI